MSERMQQQTIRRWVVDDEDVGRDVAVSVNFIGLEHPRFAGENPDYALEDAVHMAALFEAGIIQALVQGGHERAMGSMRDLAQRAHVSDRAAFQLWLKVIDRITPALRKHMEAQGGLGKKH